MAQVGQKFSLHRVQAGVMGNLDRLLQVGMGHGVVAGSMGNTPQARPRFGFIELIALFMIEAKGMTNMALGLLPIAQEMIGFRQVDQRQPAAVAFTQRFTNDQRLLEAMERLGKVTRHVVDDA